MITPSSTTDFSLLASIRLHVSIWTTRWATMIGVALLTWGVSVLDGAYHSPALVLGWTVFSVGLVLLFLTFMSVKNAVWRAFLRTLVLAIFTLVASTMALELFDRFEVRSGGSQLLASSTSVLLNAVGVQSTSDHGMIRFEHPNGIVRFMVTIEKLGVRFVLIAFIVGACVLYMQRTRIRNNWLSLLAFVCSLVLFRILFIIAAMYLVKDPYAFGAKSLFMSLWSTSVFSSLVGLVVGSYIEQPNGSPESVHDDTVWNRKGVPAYAKIGLLSLASVAGVYSVVRQIPSDKIRGRILISDKHSGMWEPSMRILDEDWFGDFSTYSFSSLVEGFGHTKQVSCSNETLTYEKLDNFDCLILKTPESDFTAAELSNIDQWVREGGVAVLVGDHTDLMGMNSRLNLISRKYGVSLNPDSVNSKTGGFSVSHRPLFFANAVELQSPAATMMTSCSLELSGAASPMLISRNSRVEGHDYANPSFFGAKRFYPEFRQGLVTLAAYSKVDKGMVIVFSDSTILSSFAIFLEGRFEFFSALINHGSTNGTTPLSGLLSSIIVCLVLLSCCIILFLGYASNVPSVSACALLLLAMAMLAANFVTTKTLDNLHASFAPHPGQLHVNSLKNKP